MSDPATGGPALFRQQARTGDDAAVRAAQAKPRGPQPSRHKII
ncbi:hypothetical protein [Streptomyces purpurogeneiscleroticus]|nr:hypothetical protein [Streptomyces purpurogeneiscleroticus]